MVVFESHHSFCMSVQYASGACGNFDEQSVFGEQRAFSLDISSVPTIRLKQC